MSETIKKELLKAYKELKELSENELTNLRYEKFRNMGEYIGG